MTEATQPEQLLDRARGLDPQALADIHDQLYPTVYRYVRGRFEDEQLAEDITAEVFVRLLDGLRRGSQIRNLRAWLLGTASNLINDHLRRKYRRPVEPLEDHETLASYDDPEEYAGLREQQRKVREAMRHLTQDQQHVLSLRFLLELPVEETARLMRKTEGAVKVLQFRALAALRKLLKE